MNQQEGKAMTMQRMSILLALCAGAAVLSLVYAQNAQSQSGGKLTVQDYMELQQLTAGYPYKIDKCTNSGYDYADMYTDDATFGVSSEWGSAGKIWFRGREELAQAGGGGKGGCKSRPPVPGRVVTHHIVTSQVITPTATGASGRSTLLALGVHGDPTAIEWQGGYEDTYVKTPQGWKFKSRLHTWPGHDWPNTAAEQAAIFARPEPTPAKSQ
jgi:SnoaL-like domain